MVDVSKWDMKFRNIAGLVLVSGVMVFPIISAKLLVEGYKEIGILALFLTCAYFYLCGLLAEKLEKVNK